MNCLIATGLTNECRELMPGTRSRQGCEECRRRRRKCDEQKPACHQCSAYNRNCIYSLRLVWSGRKSKKPLFGQRSDLAEHSVEGVGAICQTPLLAVRPELTRAVPDTADGGFVCGTKDNRQTISLPRCLPNGVPLPPRYRRLLRYFAVDILASLSCHPSIHEDLCRGLIPVMLHSPQLLSACLALSVAGFISRGLSEVDGVDISRIFGHLQSSGLELLRTSLQSSHINETLLATCLIWCLTDVFACRQGDSSWRVHLQGIRAILGGDGTLQQFVKGSGATQLAMRHLYFLYLSLQTLPHIPSLDMSKPSTTKNPMVSRGFEEVSDTGPNIDGFLGYSQELLQVLRRVNQLSHNDGKGSASWLSESDLLLGRLKGMISRDCKAALGVSICTSLSPEYGHEFLLCHKTFQQATLIHMYRRLYNMSSGSEPIQAAVESVKEMVSDMVQGQPCHTWVAMAMPLFTIGCEAFTEEQKGFVLDKVYKLEECIGSLHVRIIRQALEDMWKARANLGDIEGKLCASHLLGKPISRAHIFAYPKLTSVFISGEFRYNIILF